MNFLDLVKRRLIVNDEDKDVLLKKNCLRHFMKRTQSRDDRIGT